MSDLPQPKCKACGQNIPPPLSVTEKLEVREATWDLILKLYVLPVKDANRRCMLVQHYIAQGGPVPNSRAQAVRDALALKDLCPDPLPTETSNTQDLCQENPETKPLS